MVSRSKAADRRAVISSSVSLMKDQRPMRHSSLECRAAGATARPEIRRGNTADQAVISSRSQSHLPHDSSVRCTPVAASVWLVSPRKEPSSPTVNHRQVHSARDPLRLSAVTRVTPRGLPEADDSLLKGVSEEINAIASRKSTTWFRSLNIKRRAMPGAVGHFTMPSR